MRLKHSRVIFCLFFLSFFIRLVGIFLTELTGINPFSYGQVNLHARNADIFASHITRLSVSDHLSGSTDVRNWAFLLSTFWMIPGPSEFYAQIAIAIISTVSAINLYLLGSHFHSKQAGVLAALPVIFSRRIFSCIVLSSERDSFCWL